MPFKPAKSSTNLYAIHDPVGGKVGGAGDRELRLQYGPKPGKTYVLTNSDWIVVQGWKFRFAHAALIPNKPKLTDRRWLGFSMYFESPDYPKSFGDAPLKIAMAVAMMRIYKGRLYPPMSPYGRGNFINVLQTSKGLADLIYQAVKQWDVVKRYPEFSVDGVKWPLNTLAYSATTLRQMMSEYVPKEKKEEVENESAE